MILAHALLRAWGAFVRIIRRGLGAVGILSAMDRWATRSRVGLWVRSLLSVSDVHDFVRLDVPWWTLDSMSLVDEFLRQRPNARVFEWGSGASTLWLEKRAGQVTSVEYDPQWFAVMATLVTAPTRLLHTPAIPSDTPVVPSGMWGHRGLDYLDYVNAIETVDGDFDLIVIDGRARTACLEKAVSRLTPEGMVVFDNTNRVRYQAALRSMRDQLAAITTTGLTPTLPYSTQTTLLRRSTT